MHDDFHASVCLIRFKPIQPGILFQTCKIVYKWIVSQQVKSALGQYLKVKK